MSPIDSTGQTKPLGGDAAQLQPDVLVGAVILLVLVLAFSFDRRIAAWVHATPTVAGRAAATVRWILWHLGHVSSTVVIGLALGRYHPKRWRATAFLLLSSAAAGCAYTVIKWGVGRSRPFKGHDAFDIHPFHGGTHALILGERNAAFPSGHACLAFAMAGCLAILLPRWRWPILLLAACVAAFRVLVGAHYPSDVVAGAAIGLLAVRLTATLSLSPRGLIRGRPAPRHAETLHAGL